MFKIFLIFCGLFINSEERKSEQKNCGKSFKQNFVCKIKDFSLLTDFEQKEFTRIYEKNKFLDEEIFKKLGDIKKFLSCNYFCKNFIFEDVSFDSYREAIAFLDRHKIKEEKSLEYYILWSYFFKKKFNRNISTEEYKRYFKVALQSGIYSYDEFLEVIEWSNCYNKIFNKDIPIEQIKAIKSFVEFLKSKKLKLNNQEISKIVYVFLYIGSAKIWMIQKTLEDDLNLEKFKTILLTIFDWKGAFNVEWINRVDLDNLTKVNEIFLTKKKKISFLDYEAICIRLKSCPTMTVERLLSKEKSDLTKAMSWKKDNSITNGELKGKNTIEPKNKEKTLYKDIVKEKIITKSNLKEGNKTSKLIGSKDEKVEIFSETKKLVKEGDKTYNLKGMRSDKLIVTNEPIVDKTNIEENNDFFQKEGYKSDTDDKESSVSKAFLKSFFLSSFFAILLI